MGINIEPLAKWQGNLTNAQKQKKFNKILKTKEQDYTDGKWVKVEGAIGNLTKFVKNKTS